MRLLVTADLHYNHAKSKPLAIDLIDQINRAGADAILLAGDTAIADGDDLETCLARFTTRGPKLFLCGNHELWTRQADSHHLFTHDLPRRIQALGWQWLETTPFMARAFAIVGTIGWYDYSFASPLLNIPRRFYEAKISPGAAEHFKRTDLLADPSDITPAGMNVIARWNDGKFVKLHRSDEAFLDECLERLQAHLDAVRHVPNVIVATHHLPFRELLPPSRYNQLEFAKAYLGSDKLGDLIRRYPNVSRVFCGHSHFPAQATIDHLRAINIGSSYRHKTFLTVDLPD
jgi:3',5'-cyclic AMP phosphodiesterase CpdA